MRIIDKLIEKLVFVKDAIDEMDMEEFAQLGDSYCYGRVSKNFKPHYLLNLDYECIYVESESMEQLKEDVVEKLKYEIGVE